MKGLMLTMEIVVIAIVLLVTALVVMTIFGGQIAQFIGIINPWSATVLSENLCNQQCASWCQGHLGSTGVQWSSLTVQTQSGSKQCGEVMSAISESCACRGIPTGSVQCRLKCETNDAAGTVKTGSGGCPTPTPTCTVTCPAAIALPTDGMVQGTCR